MIGGGLAGLACGVALAESGWRVRLFEQKPFLGGRATSYVLPNGEHVDNCQHVTLGCCTNLADFYRRVGSADKIKFFDELVFLDPQGRRGTMKAGLLPAPFHMTGSFLTFAPLTMRDKLSIARAMLDIVAAKGKTADPAAPGGISMLEWLRRRRQTKGAIERFWRVVLVSALDEELDRTDARYGVDVFWKAFLINSTGYRMGVPVVPLSDLYAGCKAAIESRGGEVTLRSPVRSLNAEDTSISSVQFDAGREESADAYVFAVAHDALFDLMPDSIRRAEPSLANLSKIKTAPITGVHFWFDRPVMDEPFVTLLDTNTQWIFNKTMLYGEQKGSRQQPGTILANGNQRVLRPAKKIAPGNHRPLPPRSSPSLTARPSRPTNEIHRNQRSRRNLFPTTRSRPLAPPTTNQNPRPLLRRRLDRHRLAGHHGRRRPQRLPGRRSRPPRLR